MKSSSFKFGKKVASRYTDRRLLKSLSFNVENGYAVKSEAVKAFIKVLKDLLVIMKKGSLTGYFFDPHNTVCSKIWATPVESTGKVLNATTKHFSLLSQSK